MRTTTLLVLLNVLWATDTLQAQSAPIVFYYGLNNSHSNSWVQMSDNGIVGVVYFPHFEGSPDEGTLLYKVIYPDGSTSTDSVTTGTRLEKCVLLYDLLNQPHVFVASSEDSAQVINDYHRDVSGQWQSETVADFTIQGGKFIYELSADKGPDGSFHLLALKTRSNPDSDDYWFAWLGSNLYHLTNMTGAWEQDWVYHWDMSYTYETYVKSSRRQDIEVDSDGDVHVVFGEQISGSNDPSRLRYATNKTGSWVVETAFSYYWGTKDDAGWFPSLALDNNDVPYVSCMYINRVPTRSARWANLFLLRRLGAGDWQYEIVADHDDGYHGTDGRTYTGGLSYLLFDGNNVPHIAFCDIASSHDAYNYLNVGNVRYAVRQGATWDISTIYRQPLPTARHNATEMQALCLTASDATGTVRVVGSELHVTAVGQYDCRLLDFAWDDVAPAEPMELAGREVDGGLELSWMPNTEGDLSHYSLYRGNDEEFIPDASNRISETPDTSVIDSTWTQAGRYCYKVSAVDIFGNEGDYTLLRPGDIEVPTLLQGVKTAIRGRSVEISWWLSEDGAVDFVVFRKEEPDEMFRELLSPNISRDRLFYTLVDNNCIPGRDYGYRVDVIENNVQWTLFETDALSIPVQSLALHQNRPNPFNPVTMISFALPVRTDVDLAIFGPGGELIRTLVKGALGEGLREVVWDGTDDRGNTLSSGIYFCRLKAGKKVLTRKMVLLK